MLISAVDGKVRPLRTFTIVPILPGEACETRNSGGGGWGDPLARDPARVLDDVRNGIVSAGRARKVYGVVLDASGTSVEVAATEACRQGLRAAIGSAR
jgi:N-methylhydantoinase B